MGLAAFLWAPRDDARNGRDTPHMATRLPYGVTDCHYPHMETTQRWSGKVATEVLAQLGRRRRDRQWLAEATGIPYSTLNRRLGGESDWSIEQIDAVATAFGMTVPALLSEAQRSAAAGSERVA